MKKAKSSTTGRPPHRPGGRRTVPPSPKETPAPRPLTLELLRDSDRSVRVAAHDLVAFEYVDRDDCWRWGLATVAGLPEPRLVQLLLWRRDGRASPPRDTRPPPRSFSVAAADRAGAEARLEELRADRVRLKDEVSLINKTLAVRQAEYTSSRRKVEAEATLAEQTLREARARIRDIDARDWREIRHYRNPPAVVVLVMGAVLSVIGERCATWPQIQTRIRGPDFIHSVEVFNPSNLGEAAKRDIRERFLSNPRFTYADAMNGSQALGYLQQWVVAQVETASAAECLVEYDIKHTEERAAINDMEDKLNSFNRALRKYSDEERRLRAILDGEEDEVNTRGKLGESTKRPRANDNDNNNDDDANSSTSSSASDDDVPFLPGANSVWSFAEDLIVTLRSAILCNYDKPEGMIVRLTQDQINEIEEALKCRGATAKDDDRVEAARKKLQKELEALRGDNARLQARLHEVESSKHETQKELQNRQRELDKLNQAITESGVTLHTPRQRSANSPRRPHQQLTPRTPHQQQQQENDNNNNNNNNVTFMTPREDDGELVEKIADLEDRLKRALYNNPTAAQVQLLEDDLRAVQEELRCAKDELDNFRTANAPNYYTSSALRMDKEGTPEAQLAAAQRQIEELERALEDALAAGKESREAGKNNDNNDDGNNNINNPSNVNEGLQSHIQQLREEIRQQQRDNEDVSERLNEELHAHEDTRQKLAEKEAELQALWDRQLSSEGEKESVAAALDANKQEMANIRKQLRGKDDESKVLQGELEVARREKEQRELKDRAAKEKRLLHLQEVLERIKEESRRQSGEAKSVEKTLEEARALLGKVVPAW